MRLHNLTLLGTSHIAKQSLDDVARAMEDRPDILALELDKNRFLALMSPKKRKLSYKDIKHIGVLGFLFSLVGEYAERKMGEQVGVSPGSEMKLAAHIAAKQNIPVAFIDQPIEVTLRKFSRAVTWRERFRFVGDVITAPFKRKSLPFDLRTVPSRSLVKSLTSEVKVRYPNVYRVLIDERNQYMARKLASLMRKGPEKRILAVIGAGHEEEMLELVKEYLRG